MGHAFVSGEGTTQERAWAELKIVSRETSEYGHALETVKWKNTVFDTIDEAYEFVQKASDELYWSSGAVGVGYKHYPKLPNPTKELNTLKNNVAVAYTNLNNFERTIHYKNTSNKTVGCKHCGTRNVVATMRSNKCVNCGHDLRPASALKKRDALKQKWETAMQKYEAKLAQIRKRSKYVVKYLCGGWVHV